MTTEQKKAEVKKLVEEMLNGSQQDMLKKIDKALNSGAINISEWEPEDAPMIIPKCIVMAILEDEARQYSATGTSFERQVKKEVRNIKYHL